jgi:rRNA-processing protein FCF1
MPSAISEPPVNPVVDTNVLFDFLLWRFCADTKTPTPSCLSDYFSAEITRNALQWYLDKAKPIHTLPHVIAEINGLVKGKTGWRKDRARLSEFWRFSQKEMAGLLLDEHLVRVAEMNGDDLGAFGPTDCAILELAKRTGRAVVTEDRDLRGRLTQDQIEALNCSEILALWQGWNA